MHWVAHVVRAHKGTDNRMSRLTDDIVAAIVAEYATGKRGKANAHRYGITPSHYNRLGRRACWKHLQLG